MVATIAVESTLFLYVNHDTMSGLPISWAVLTDLFKRLNLKASFHNLLGGQEGRHLVPQYLAHGHEYFSSRTVA